MVDHSEFIRIAAQATEHARVTGGCDQCLKPHDPAGPSCNAGRCVARWKTQNALTQRAKGGEPT